MRARVKDDRDARARAHAATPTRPRAHAPARAQRTYTRIALGRDGSMDVVAADGSGMRGQVLLLIPVLWALQGGLWLGVSLRDQLLAFAANAAGATLDSSRRSSRIPTRAWARPRRHRPGSGQLWLRRAFVIAVGNLHTTTVTLVNKFAARRERRPASIARPAVARRKGRLRASARTSVCVCACVCVCGGGRCALSGRLVDVKERSSTYTSTTKLSARAHARAH